MIDEDLAHTGSGVVTRHGFAQMTHEVAMGQVGIILCLEASRIARNNAQWYRLLGVAPVGYRTSKNGRKYYRQPAYLLTTDLRTSAIVLLQAYFDRWGIDRTMVATAAA